MHILSLVVTCESKHKESLSPLLRQRQTKSFALSLNKEGRKWRPNGQFAFYFFIWNHFFCLCFECSEWYHKVQTPSVYVFVWFSSDGAPEAGDKGQVTFARTPFARPSPLPHPSPPLPDTSNSPCRREQHDSGTPRPGPKLHARFFCSVCFVFCFALYFFVK